MTDPTEPTDEALLDRFIRGDAEALGLLAERYEPSLVGLARAMLGGRDDAARDAVQEAWVRVIRHARSFDGRSAFRTWVYRIVINKCHDMRAGLARNAAAPLAEKDQRAAAPSREDPSGAGHRGAELNGTLRHAMDDLSPGSRLILLLCYHRELSHTQVADILDIPLGTVKSRLHAALTTLRERLAPEAAS